TPHQTLTRRRIVENSVFGIGALVKQLQQRLLLLETHTARLVTVDNVDRNTFLVAQPLEPDRSPFRIVTRCRLSKTIGDIDVLILQDHVTDRVVLHSVAVAHIPRHRGTGVSAVDGAVSDTNRGTDDVLVHAHLPVDAARTVVLNLNPEQALFPANVEKPPPRIGTQLSLGGVGGQPQTARLVHLQFPPLDNIAAGGEEKQGRAERRHVLFIELLWELGPHQEPDIPGGRLGRNIGAPNPDGTLHQRQLAHNIIVVFAPVNTAVRVRLPRIRHRITTITRDIRVIAGVFPAGHRPIADHTIQLWDTAFKRGLQRQWVRPEALPDTENIHLNPVIRLRHTPLRHPRIRPTTKPQRTVKPDLDLGIPTQVLVQVARWVHRGIATVVIPKGDRARGRRPVRRFTVTRTPSDRYPVLDENVIGDVDPVVPGLQPNLDFGHSHHLPKYTCTSPPACCRTCLRTVSTNT